MRQQVQKKKWLKLFTRRLIFKEKLLPFCCVNYVFNFLLYHTSKIQHPTSKIWYECIRIFEYFPIRIFVRIIFVSFVWYEYIRIFVRIIFLIRIYSDIRSYRFLDINIFEYSFVSKIYIRHTLIWNTCITQNMLVGWSVGPSVAELSRSVHGRIF